MIEYDTWEHVPDFTDPPKEARVGRPDIVAIANAAEFVSFPSVRAERILVFSFAWDVVRDATLAKQFWAEKGGRAEVFLLPSWQRNLRQIGAPQMGSCTLHIDHPDYAATYLTSTARDEVGRFIFVWDQTHGLQVLKVLSASAIEGGSALTTEQTFAFTPDREAIIGFAMLARFDADESEWRSHDPSHVRVELTFRTVRESILAEDVGALNGEAVYQSLPFDSFAATVEDTPLEFDLAETLGPLNRCISQNSTYSVRWAAWPSSSGIRTLKHAEPGAVTPPDETQGRPCSYFTEAVVTDHLAFAFDQTAYELFAWHSAKDEITVKSFTTTISFPGFAPSLFFNGQVNIQARLDGLTDVVCYYLKRGSAGLYARFQRDGFATEYLMGGYPVRPLYLLTVHSVDGVVHSMTAIDEGFRKMRLDATYPSQPVPPPDPFVAFAFNDAVAGFASLGEIADEYGIITAAIADAVDGSAGIAITYENVAELTTFEDAQGGSAAIANIAYELAICQPSVPVQITGGLASISDITYDHIVPPTTPQAEATAAAISITSIYYGP